MLRIEVRPYIIDEVGPFLLLRVWFRPVIRHVRNPRADQFLCYDLRSALSLDMFEIQMVVHFSCYVSRSALSF